VPTQVPVPSTSWPAVSPVVAAARKTALTAWEGIWYVISTIWLGAGYFHKVAAKKAMNDFGLTQMTSGEQFWYVFLCVWFGLGYFLKVAVSKALVELPQFQGDDRVGSGTL
jgi:hypothetical protein